jgi:DNA-binding CsgD family transcriptional regulator
MFEEALAIFRRERDQFGAASMLGRLGWAHLERGELPRAAARLAESLDLSWAGGYRAQLIWCFSFVARLAARRGRPEAAARLFGAETALRAVVGEPVAEGERAGYEAGVAQAWAALPAEAFAADWAAGEALPLAEAVAEARALASELAHPAPAPPRPTAAVASLTPREREVLRLLTEGRPDREIAAALGLSYRTVTSYVTSLLNKLGLDSRAAAAAYAVRHGLDQPVAAPLPARRVP